MVHHWTGSWIHTEHTMQTLQGWNMWRLVCFFYLSSDLLRFFFITTWLLANKKIFFWHFSLSFYNTQILYQTETKPWPKNGGMNRIVGSLTESLCIHTATKPHQESLAVERFFTAGVCIHIKAQFTPAKGSCVPNWPVWTRCQKQMSLYVWYYLWLKIDGFYRKGYRFCDLTWTDCVFHKSLSVYCSLLRMFKGS